MENVIMYGVFNHEGMTPMEKLLGTDKLLQDAWLVVHNWFAEKFGNEKAYSILNAEWDKVSGNLSPAESDEALKKYNDFIIEKQQIHLNEATKLFGNGMLSWHFSPEVEIIQECYICGHTITTTFHLEK